MSILNLKTAYFTNASNEHATLLFYAVLVTRLSIALVVIAYARAEQKPDAEKRSVYECGFEPFEDARREFDIKFYLVGILFILFDLEIIFMFPWSRALNSYLMFFPMAIFVAILVIGFAYEIAKGALDW